MQSPLGSPEDSAENTHAAICHPGLVSARTQLPVHSERGCGPRALCGVWGGTSGALMEHRSVWGGQGSHHLKDPRLALDSHCLCPQPSATTTCPPFPLHFENVLLRSPSAPGSPAGSPGLFCSPSLALLCSPSTAAKAGTPLCRSPYPPGDTSPDPACPLQGPVLLLPPTVARGASLFMLSYCVFAETPVRPSLWSSRGSMCPTNKSPRAGDV